MEQELDRSLAEVSHILGKFRADMDAIDVVARKISSKTTRLIKAVLSLLILVSGFIFFQVYTLTMDMTSMLEQMNTMFVHFGGMSSDMKIITTSVNNMGANVQGIPNIADAMKNMNRDVGGMSQSVQGMKGDVESMNADVTRIGQGTSEMAGRFVHVSRAVDHMRYNVNHMATPTDMMNPFNFMIPR
ncbi:MAG: hypothetical protein H7831_01260 [Magnetococcus sp. WYHC-3]